MRRLVLLMLVAVLSVGQLLAQSKAITGKVTDEKGNGISNASISIKGSEAGATSDVNGIFSVEVPVSLKVLVISAVGYQSEKINITNKDNVLIVLKLEDKELTGVITIGYVTKKQPTISMSEVKNKDIRSIPLTNINDVLQGKATGLQISSGSGQPGSVQSVRIRGIGSISAGANPLYVIDGIIVQTGQVVTGSNQASNDILSNLSPESIESITVLKNASALALYGSRGANGVIVITTKKGKAGTSQISFKTQYGMVTPSFGNFKMMDARQVYDYERAVLKLNGTSQTQIDAQYPISLLNKTFNWFDAAFKQGTTQNHEISISGGNEKTRQYISLGYFNQDGTVLGSSFKRINSQINIEQTVNKRLKVGVNTNLSFSNTLNAGTGALFSSPIYGSLRNSPLLLYPYAPDGSLYRGYEPAFKPSTSGQNFLYSVPLNYNKLGQFRGIGKLYGNLKIADWLTFSQNIAVDLIYSKEKIFIDPTTADGINISQPSKGGSVQEYLTNPFTVTSQTSITGNFKLGDKHEFDYLALMEYQKNNTSNFNARGTGMVNGRLDVLDVTALPATKGGSEDEFAFISYLAQLNYIYNSKYSFSASIRRDGSSRFGVNRQYATFYSLGGAWRIIDEPFMQNQKVFSDLKFRASFGTSGNAQFLDANGLLSNYASQRTYRYNASYNGLPGSVPSTIGNEDLGWEKNRQADIGFEMAFLQGRIKATLETYQRISLDLLQNVPISSTTGFITMQSNIGKLENRGIEMALNTINIQSKDFMWVTDFNISYNVNEIRATYKDQDILGGTLRITRVGKPINSWYLPEWSGVDPANGDPLWIDANGNKTNNYNKARRILAGTGYPKYTMSLNNTVTFKSFSFSFLLYGITGSKIFNQTNSLVIDTDGNRGLRTNYHVNAGKNFWTTPGQQAERPKPVPNGNKLSSSVSTRYIESGDYLRLRNVTLSYNLPNNLFGNTKISEARFYVTGTNLFTFTKYTGVDPEQDINSNEVYKYPVSKSITVGLDITF